MARRLAVLTAIGAGIALAAAVSGKDQPARQTLAPAPIFGFDIVREYPHDPEAFTQGLVYRDGFLYESTGLNGRSSLRKVRLETGEVVQRRDVDARHFAEGLTDWGSRLIQLTYQDNIAFVYDLESFEPTGTFSYAGEGWGLTRDEKRLIMSDGTTRLRFLDPDTFRELGRVEVTDGGRPVDDLNELELVNGLLYANVWFRDTIAIIRPDSGAVAGWIDLAPLQSRLTPKPDDPAGAVLNGIAYDAAGNRLFVTGKLWPRLFEIRPRLR